MNDCLPTASTTTSSAWGFFVGVEVRVDVGGGADVGVPGKHLREREVAGVAQKLGDGGVTRLMHRPVRQRACATVSSRGDTATTATGT
jgi:hypothetical protein